MLVKISHLTIEQIASICDHTFLDRTEAFKARAKSGENPIRQRENAFYYFLDQTLQLPHQPYAICVRCEDVWHAKDYLEKNNSKLKIAATVGFPDGAWYSPFLKMSETSHAVSLGAGEVDFVMNYRDLKENKSTLVYSEISLIVHEAKHFNKNAKTKMILETSELNNRQIIEACKLADECGVDFVKTSTGFSSAGATPEHLRIMRANFPRGLKMSGGVNEKNVYELLEAASGRTDGYIDIDPMKIRIGESSLLTKLISQISSGN